MKITTENIRNKDALWQWIKKESYRDNIESVELETVVEDIPLDNTPVSLKHVTGRILTIKLGADIDYHSLDF